jgi:Tc toxin complex TcA C-terminal TcB-binding domain
VAQAQARKAVAEQRVKIAQLQQRFAEENRDFLDMREFSARLWYELAQLAKRIKQRYLDMATEIAFLMERAYNGETERGLSVIRYDYSRTSANNLLSADMLQADIDYFMLDHVTTTKTKKIPVKKTISLADSYAMAFHILKTKGRCFFITELADFDREHPGLYLAKLRNVELIFVGITGATSIAGSLRNIGVSKFRLEGGAVVSRVYPSDVMALSQYDIRQDALAFRFNPNDLRLFENNGIETLWQIDLPLDANDFDYNEILDAQLVLYYDGFFSPALEQTVKAALPKKGSASRAFSMRLSFPDELFYFKNKGDAEISFDASMFPRSQTGFKRTALTLKVAGKNTTIANLTLRLTSANHGSEVVVKTDANGLAPDGAGQPLNALRGEALLDKWTIKITAADNPGLVQNGVLDLSGVNDVMAFFEYTFDYRQ